MGGEAGCTIDHHRPLRGPYAQPQLESEYSNLYWTCRECNDNKSDTWPTPDEEVLGMKFLDPCTPEGDHDVHWKSLPDGSLKHLTTIGEYTIEHLLLWRDQLTYHRACLYRWQHERDDLIGLLSSKRMPEAMRLRIENRIVELNELLEPSVFDRPRSK